MDSSDLRGVVRRGYDVVSYRYRSDHAGGGQYGPWISELCERIPGRAAVLDLGCGCGVPVARLLVQAGHTVTGVDFSEVQIGRARQLIPTATFIHADATTTTFPAESFDAVVCFYALIHMPLDEQPSLLARIAGWIRPGGWLLATAGHDAWTGTEDNWLGSGATMWWSHADAATYHSWISDAGLVVAESRVIPEGNGGHTLFWAHRP